MTSVKAAAALAVVIVVVCAVAAYALIDGGRDSPTGSGAIGNTVSVGDSYTLETTASGSDTSTVTTYEVIAMDGDVLTVEETTDGTVTTTRESVSGFLDAVRVEAPVGTYQRTETISTAMGDIRCDVYFSEVNVGNGTSVSTYDWIGTNTNILYKTEVTIRSSITSETYTTSLVATNMIGSSSGTDVPSAPTISGTVRTDLVAGDYIEYTEFEGDRREDVERFTVLSVGDGYVVYSDDDDLDDAMRTTAERFVSLLVYSGSDPPVRTETIETSFGTVECDVYQPDRYPGYDWDERLTLYVGSEDGVIYRIVVSEWGDRDEVYELTGTSLFLDAPSGGPGPSQPATDSRYGVEISVGDYYVIKESDERYEETKEVIAIDNGRLIVKETEGSKVEIDRTSVSDFLDDIMITQSQLDRLTPTGTETVDGIPCSVYTYRDDGDTVTLYVDADRFVRLVVEDEGWEVESTRLVELHIQSLA